MEIAIIARFRASPGRAAEVEEALRAVMEPTRREEGCLRFDLHRHVRDGGLFFIHSRWRDEAAFDQHASLPHTVSFIDCVQPLSDHPLDINRTVVLA